MSNLPFSASASTGLLELFDYVCQFFLNQMKNPFGILQTNPQIQWDMFGWDTLSYNLFCTLLVVLMETMEGRWNSKPTVFFCCIFSLLPPTHQFSTKVDNAFPYSRTISLDLDSLGLLLRLRCLYVYFSKAHPWDSRYSARIKTSIAYNKPHNSGY